MSTFSELYRDAGLALRLLARRPGFASVAIITLALGIGAPTAMFSVVNAVLLQPLPYPEPDRIVQFRIESQSPMGPVAFDALPAEMAQKWAAESAVLGELSLFNDQALTLTSSDGPFRLTGITATPNLFDVLRVAPAYGRGFVSRAPDAREIVLSYATWTKFFRSDASVLNTLITMDGVPYRVVGIMADDFRFPSSEAAFWTPLLINPGGTRGMLLPAVARMRPGATLAGVIAEGRERMDTGDTRVTQTLIVRTLQEQMVGGVQRILWILLAAVGFVLIIATSNIALLLMTRGAAREREFSIRLALGAGRGRLVRQLFVEGLVLGAAGGTAGLALAQFALTLLIRTAPADIPRLAESSINGPVLGFTLLMTMLTSLVFGVLSVGRTLAVHPIRALSGASAERRISAIAFAPRTRLKVMAAIELALTMVLLVGAGLLLRSFVRLVQVDQGFDPRGSLAMQINLPLSRYPTPEARMAFHDRLLERLTHVPGVEHAGIATTMPNRQPSGRFAYSSAGVQVPSADPFSMSVYDVHMVTEGFLDAMGLRLRAGRTFNSGDRAGSEPVMVISEALARQQFPNRNPLGQQLYSESGNRQVVGVVDDVRPAIPGAEPSAGAYVPLRQSTDVLEWFGTATIVVQGHDPRSLTNALRAVVLGLDANMPPFNVRGLDEEVSNLVASPRFAAMLLAMFGVVALVMASVGVYGVMSYSAGLRTREIGVRMAIGSTRAQVMRLMLMDGLIVVASGLAAGLIAAIWLARALTGLLHEVTPADPIALVSVAAILAASGLIAALIPARRATRLSVLDALRDE